MLVLTVVLEAKEIANQELVFLVKLVTSMKLYMYHSYLFFMQDISKSTVNS